MDKGIIEALSIDQKILEVLSSQDIEFLNNIRQKEIALEEEISKTEENKDKIIKAITDTNKDGSSDPKELRESLSNSESVLESIEIVLKNLTELKTSLSNIEKSVIILSERYKLGVENGNYADDLKELMQDISIVRTFEENAKSDNEKNYMIINSFLEKQEKEEIDTDSKVEFSNLTLENLQDNPVLRIYADKVKLPYTKKEIEDLMKAYPDYYKTVQDVITKEFVVHMSTYKYPILARFKEAYYLCRHKEMKSILDSFNYAKSIMFRSDINPYIVAAVKSQRQLEDYITCIDENKLDEYPHFKIIFEVTPLAVK